MTVRDSIIRITPKGADSEHILWRQPWHDNGLAYEFSFGKAIASPNATCDLTIYNANDRITNLFSFEKFTERPYVEIFAGQRDKDAGDYSEPDSIIAGLPLVYSGFPFWIYDQKITGGRNLTVQLNDSWISASRGTTAVTMDVFMPNTTYKSIIEKWLNKIQVAADFSQVEDVLGQRLQRRVQYAGSSILYAALPALCRYLKIGYSFDEAGKIVFVPLEKAMQPTEPELISESTGLIEYPTRVNWTHYSVKTFYGLPRVFGLGDWVRIWADEYFGRAKLAPIVGMVITVEHTWNDAEAEITYVVSPEGTPTSSKVIIEA